MNTTAQQVLVAHGNEQLAGQIGQVLTQAGLSPTIVPSGSQALALLDEQAVSAVVLDVALDDVMSFQIIERIKARPELAHVKIVLVASVYNKTAYKRRPSSLYGADDYVEQHHIPDHLPERLCRLLGVPTQRASTAAARQRLLENLDPRMELAGMDRVRALAHNIVADIALYHQDDVARAARGEPAGELPAALNEGRRLLAELVDPHEYSGADPILDAFRTLLVDMGLVTR